MARKKGKNTQVVSVRMPEDIKTQIEKLADFGHRSENQQILLLVEIGIAALARQDGLASSLLNDLENQRASSLASQVHQEV